MSDPEPTRTELSQIGEPGYLRDRLTQAITAGIRRADDEARKPHTVFAGDAERYAPYVADALAPSWRSCSPEPSCRSSWMPGPVPSLTGSGPPPKRYKFGIDPIMKR